MRAGSAATEFALPGTQLPLRTVAHKLGG